MEQVSSQYLLADRNTSTHERKLEAVEEQVKVEEWAGNVVDIKQKEKRQKKKKIVDRR